MLLRMSDSYMVVLARVIAYQDLKKSGRSAFS